MSNVSEFNSGIGFGLVILFKLIYARIWIFLFFFLCRFDPVEEQDVQFLALANKEVHYTVKKIRQPYLSNYSDFFLIGSDVRGSVNGYVFLEIGRNTVWDMACNIN